MRVLLKAVWSRPDAARSRPDAARVCRKSNLCITVPIPSAAPGRVVTVGWLLELSFKQEAQLSQRDRVAACLNVGKNISATSVHLTLLYVTSLTSTNHHFTVLWHHLCT